MVVVYIYKYIYTFQVKKQKVNRSDSVRGMQAVHVFFLCFTQAATLLISIFFNSVLFYSAGQSRP